MEVRNNKIAKLVAELSDDDLRKAFHDITHFRDTGVLTQPCQLSLIEETIRNAMGWEGEHFRYAEEYILMEIGRRFTNIAESTEQGEQWIQIWYSWGDQEAPVEVPKGIDAWVYMKQLVIDEAEVSQDGHDEESGVRFYPDENKIVLHYGYDDEYCYYLITDEEEFDPFAEEEGEGE